MILSQSDRDRSGLKHKVHHSQALLPYEAQVQQFLGRCQQVNCHKENLVLRIKQERSHMRTVGKLLNRQTPLSLALSLWFSLLESGIAILFWQGNITHENIRVAIAQISPKLAGLKMLFAPLNHRVAATL